MTPVGHGSATTPGRTRRGRWSSDPKDRKKTVPSLAFVVRCVALLCGRIERRAQAPPLVAARGADFRTSPYLHPDKSRLSPRCQSSGVTRAYTPTMTSEVHRSRIPRSNENKNRARCDTTCNTRLNGAYILRNRKHIKDLRSLFRTS